MAIPADISEAAQKTIYLKDYRAPAFQVKSTRLDIDIHEGYTVVDAELQLSRSGSAAADEPLRLHGVDLELELIEIDGLALAAERYRQEGEELVISHVPAGDFSLHTRVHIHPEKNTALEGLYCSNGMYCTQCEAEGFRKITFYPDRPDVMSRFVTTIRADKQRFPVLLANGNPVASGDLPGGRHFVAWEDPFPKPSYLFAMVAGNLALHSDVFVTMSGRRIDLRIYVEARDVGKTDHAMESLKRSMRWDEEVFGREYDLDIFMIVAVSHFNMGAMENKGLNIFNTSCVLAHPATTTDAGFQRVESVVAHEYFHNWSGNRVTCRDWFQLSLKEGFTVFRDQQFSADMLSASVQRIEDVNFLRAYQFAEDAGPLAHPVRPDSFVEINNFYTATVYEKGSEIVRMLHTVLGPEKFRAGTDLYFSRHDGQAVTVEDFVQSLSDASDVNLDAFMQWYRQPGTPTLQVSGEFKPAAQEYHLTLRQQLHRVDGYPEPRLLPVPVRMALLGDDGNELPLHMNTGQGAVSETVLLLQQESETFVFKGIGKRPLPSILRDFSAPVRVEQQLSAEEKVFLLRHDSNGFNRWMIAQDLLTAECLRLAADIQAGRHLLPDAALLAALEAVLPGLAKEDPALAAKILQIPSLLQLMDAVCRPDPEALHAARQGLRHAIGHKLETWLGQLCDSYLAMDYSYSAAAIAERSLRNTALGLLVDMSGRYHELAVKQYRQALHMTDAAAALTTLVHAGSNQALALLEDFALRWQDEALVMDQWFAIQASAPSAHTIERVAELRCHSDFHRDNPNRVRALIGQFANNNPLAFHDSSGRGYELLLEEVAFLDGSNPQIAARLLGAMSTWARFDSGRQGLAKTALERLQTQARSSDVLETVSRLLAPGNTKSCS
ncbi:MAG: aminopeptidase N [Pedobacter sp.]|nr:aminopeptidase N [Pedobacter sp.]